jgi:hypothetical protein
VERERQRENFKIEKSQESNSQEDGEKQVL